MRPLVFAHRGGAQLAPENTLPAFDNGLALGADGLELDVHLSRDGVPVVLHDATLDRTTDGTGPVAARTAAELALLDAGFRFERGGAFPFRGRGIGVPALADLLDRYRQTSLIIELKMTDARLARAVVDAVHAAGASDRVTIGSFHEGALDAVRAYDPALRTGADRDEIRSGVTASPRPTHSGDPVFHAFQVPEIFAGIRIVTPEFIARAHDLGVPVVVWTVNAEEDMRRLLEWGVDGLITDRPDLCVPLVREWDAGR
ncbi:MAG: glycerophosphodiester phosphodiesterase [Acidobacteria bacterium]|nr:glycerophosphodiester phosphodiesterase [Acidobacteriota bacterium]